MVVDMVEIQKTEKYIQESALVDIRIMGERSQ